MQEERIFSEGSVLFAQLIVRFHPLCFQIDPCPVNAEYHSKDSRKVEVQKRIAQGQIIDDGCKNQAAVSLTFPKQEFEKCNKSPAYRNGEDKDGRT
jgi:hypothetical protein